MRGLPIITFFILAMSSLAVSACSTKQGVDVLTGGATASASDIPALAALLDKAGWLSTPELSGAFKPGDIFAVTDQGHQWQGAGCFAVEPRISTYTSTEVVSQLQMGVRTPLMGVQSGLAKKLKFSTPMHEAIPGMGLTPTAECNRALNQAAEARDISQWYVVKEVLRAEIAEQTCGKVDARGTFNPFVQADASLASACSVQALEPVAVAYRIVPVLDLLGGGVAASPLVGAPPTPGSPVPPTHTTEPSLTVSCDFSDGWAVAIPEDKYDGDPMLMQMLIGLTEDYSFWVDYAGDLSAFVAKPCTSTPTSLPVVGGAYYLLIGQANTYSARGDYQDNGHVQRIDIDGPVSRSISWRDLDMTWLCISCPYLYVWTGDGYEFRTEIIVDQIGPRAERPQRRNLGVVPVIQGQVRLRISEEEDEVSHLDALALRVGSHTLRPASGLLAHDDSRYLSMRRGDTHDLVFDVDLPDGEYDAEVIADGYYVPLAPIR